MSIIAPALRRTWWPYAAVAAAVAIAGTIVVLDAVRPTAGATGTRPAARTTIAAPGIEQARWEIQTFASGSNGRPSKAEIRAIRAQKPEVVGAVEAIYDAVLLQPHRLETIVSRSFAPAAAKAFLASKIGVPRGSHEVQIMKKSARIGIDALGASHAAAKVDIVATGQAPGGEWRMSHSATLWLEKNEGSWRVIGFDLAQEPVE